MESRTITQVKIYKLIMNRVTHRVEDCSIVAISGERENLVNWYKSQLAEQPWIDSLSYYKVFKEGSDLEWFNPVDLDSVDHWGFGIQEEWVNEDVFYEVSGRFTVV